MCIRDRGEDAAGEGFRSLLDAPLLLIDDLGTEPMMRNITVEYLFKMCIRDRCIHCGACIGECPTKAIHWRGARKGRAPHRWVRIAAWCAALAVLAGAIWFFNKPETTGGEVQPQAAVSASPAVDADNALQTPVPGRADEANLTEATAIPGRAAADADDVPQASVPGREGEANLTEATAVPSRTAADADNALQTPVPVSYTHLRSPIASRTPEPRP